MTAEREAMTLKQVRDRLREEAKMLHVSTGTLNSTLCSRMADAIDAHLSRAAEPVYQTRTSDDAWWDISKEQYDITWEPNRRILYTHPPEPARDAELLQWLIDRYSVTLSSGKVQLRLVYGFTADSKDQIKDVMLKAMQDSKS